MKLRAISKATIFSLIPISVTLATFLVPNPATAQSLGQAQSDCMRQTLYDSFGNVRRGMTAEAAAFACGSAKVNSSVSECVLQTMYDSFGNIRQGMSAEAAAFACADHQGFPIPVIILEP